MRSGRCSCSVGCCRFGRRNIARDLFMEAHPQLERRPHLVAARSWGLPAPNVALPRHCNVGGLLVLVVAAVHDPAGLRGAASDPKPLLQSRRRAISEREVFVRVRKVILPLALLGCVAGSIFTFSLPLGDDITADVLSAAHQVMFFGNVVADSALRGPATCHLARGLRRSAGLRHGCIPPHRTPARRV